MRIDPVSAALLGAALLLFVMPNMPATAASGVPAFCVKIGGPKGPDDHPLICRFFNYQDCLDAAADLHGNCVANMDYKGDASSAPTKPRRRPSQ